jgi:hypothetical protein
MALGYTGSARNWELTRVPSINSGGIKVWSGSTDDVTTKHTLLFYFKCQSGSTLTLKNGGSGGTVLWVGEASDFHHFHAPIEFPDGMHATVSGTVYIGYKS